MQKYPTTQDYSDDGKYDGSHQPSSKCQEAKAAYVVQGSTSSTRSTRQSLMTVSVIP
jgi:hypothetical protein